MNRKFCLIIIFLIIIDMIILSYNYFFVYHVKLIGQNPYIVNYKDQFVDPGIEVKYRGKIFNDYKVDGNVNTNTIGEYKIKYTIGNKIKERLIIVKDVKGPNIELNQKSITINYKEEFKDPGYKAIDNYDGDLTDKVVVNNNIENNKLGEYEVTYSVRDSFNNESKAIRKVKVVDNEKPVIKFKNNINTYGIIGKKVKLDDYEAIDNYDGNLTDKVTIDGKVNSKKEGLYKITYKVKDSFNNEEVVNRVVNIQEKNTKGIPVLMYHWFYDDTKGEKPGIANSHNYIAKTELERQLKYLHDEKFYYPSWQELEDYIDGKIDLPKKSIIITDDDCKDSFLEIAIPLFQKYEVPVTSYCISKKHNYQKYLKEEYVDFESHTDSMHEVKCNTAWFGALMCSSYQEIYDDIKLSIKKLGNSNSFAYPYGHYNDTAIKALKDNGIKLAFTINDGRVKRGANKYKLPRVRISSWTSIDTYKNLVK